MILSWIDQKILGVEDVTKPRTFGPQVDLSGHQAQILEPRGKGKYVVWCHGRACPRVSPWWVLGAVCPALSSGAGQHSWRRERWGLCTLCLLTSSRAGWDSWCRLVSAVPLAPSSVLDLHSTLQPAVTSLSSRLCLSVQELHPHGIPVPPSIHPVRVHHSGHLNGWRHQCPCL